MTDTNKERAGRFTKKPVTIDAWLIDPANKPHPSWVHNAFAGSDIDWCPAGKGLYINTLEGHMLGGHGDYLIRGVQSELYACKAHIFAATYEPEARASLAANAPAAPTGWYALAADGMATLCVDRDDAEKTAANSEKKWPHLGPYRAVQLYTAPPAPTEQWRDIETAPQDGTRVILAEAEKVFHGGFVGVQFKEHRDADGNYLDQTEADAYWMNFEEGDVCHPTHWQPEPALPAPPQGAAKEE